MLGADDAAELRTLQERAYGRAGALSAVEASRLRRLEAEQKTVVPSNSGSPPAPHAGPHSEARADGGRAPAVADAPSPRSDDGARESPPAPATASVTTASALPNAFSGAAARVRLRPQRRLMVLLLLVSTAIGIGAGWLLFADRGAASMSLTSTQQDWQSELIASGRYDPGSVRALREEEGVVAWYATKDDGAQVCIVLGDGDSTVPACAIREQALAQGVSASHVAVVDESQTLDVDAYMYLTDDGEPAMFLTSAISIPQSSAQFATAEEAATAVALAEEVGLDRRSIELAGYDGDTPIWVGVDKATQRYCLVIGGATPSPPMVCDDSLMLTGADRTLELELADSDGVTRYEYRFGYGQGYLTVTKDREGDDAAGE